MKKVFILITVLFLSAVSAFGFAAGLYITPKFSFEAESPGGTTNIFLFNIGGGAAIGYDFFKLTRRVPVRVDFEYLIGNQLNTNQATTLVHNFGVNVYYDINLFPIKRSKLPTTTLDELYSNDPLMSFYLMASFAGRLTSVSPKPTDPKSVYDTNFMTINGTNYTALTFLFGFGAGFSVNVNSFIAVDAMYRIMFGPSLNLAHEALLGVRFTMPKNKLTFGE